MCHTYNIRWRKENWGAKVELGTGRQTKGEEKCGKRYFEVWNGDTKLPKIGLTVGGGEGVKESYEHRY